MKALLGIYAGSALLFQVQAQSQDSLLEKLSIRFKGDAKIEVGSTFVGLSFHHSTPLPQRVSFYYPVANSIDNSTDYWRRDTTFVISAGVRFDGEPVSWLDKRGSEFTHTPFSVDFTEREQDKIIKVGYHFTRSRAAVVITYQITNTSQRSRGVEFFTRYTTALHTSHSYKLQLPKDANVQKGNQAAAVSFPMRETGNSMLSVLTLGENNPCLKQYVRDSVACDSLKLLFPEAKLAASPAVNYIFRDSLQPGETFIVTQELISTTLNEAEQTAAYLEANTTAEITVFEKEKLEHSGNGLTFTTGDAYLDKSVLWARAILETTKHYIAGDTIPMPCPAEYNFFFTHDVLLTDLAAIQFDPNRVKHDLQFITAKANADYIIPHAYYWQDTAFVTEFADHDNWNNFWFLITSASYLQHTMDTSFIRSIYPYLQKSLTQALLTREKDSLMWSFRPDWWDIGHRYGPRSYMTILAIRAIRASIYIGTLLGENPEMLAIREHDADGMQAALIRQLWDEKAGFLMNAIGLGQPDPHFYCGSLLAAHYGLLNQYQLSRTVKSAGQQLLDPRTGISVAAPMDFDTLSSVWNFVGNEVGAKYYYFNGGIWPHANAWFALALIAAENRDSAYQFIRSVMSVNGVMDGPNGQPAMYEVRNANSENPTEYGTIDKPQFMWAGGWYLYSLYYLYALGEDQWNLRFSPYLREGQNQVSFGLTINGVVTPVTISGAGAVRKQNFQLFADGKAMHSLVLPNSGFRPNALCLTTGTETEAQLQSTSSVLEKIESSGKQLRMILFGFKGHRNETIIHLITKPKKVTVDGTEIPFAWEKKESKLTVSFTHPGNRVELLIMY